MAFDLTFGQRAKLIAMLSGLQVQGLGEARAMNALMDAIEFSAAEAAEISFALDYETGQMTWDPKAVGDRTYSLALTSPQAAALVRALDRVPVTMVDRKWLLDLADACKSVA